MAEVKMRYSKQRETIYEVLKNDYSHPNVDTIYMNVKKIIPDISLGTVYRNLNLLTSQKRIIRIDTGDGTYHYDATIEPHFHVVCNQCGCIHDLFLDHELALQISDQLQNKYNGEIHSIQLIIHGTCEDCLKEKQG